MTTIPCPGCRRLFSFGALSQHLARTSQPACRAIYEQQRSYLPGVDPKSEPEDDSEEAEEAPMQIFAGDYFGEDYADDNFPGWDGAGGESSTSSSDESSSSDDEPDPYLEPPPAPLANPAEAGVNPMEDEHGRLFTGEERHKAEEDIWVEPVVYGFPGRAGEAVEEENESGYVGYKDSLGAGSHNNPYAPFASKIDWDMARWAKLRGPGSTAVTELMGIDNVRYPLTINIVSCLTNYSI